MCVNVCFCVRACVFSMLCGFGVDVDTHRCWYEDSSTGCGFHEVSFPRIACMLILNDLTNRNLQSNTIFLSVRLFWSCGTRTKLAVIRRTYPLHIHILAHYLRYLFFTAEGTSPIATPVSHLVFGYGAFLCSFSSFLAG